MPRFLVHLTVKTIKYQTTVVEAADEDEACLKAEDEEGTEPQDTSDEEDISVEATDAELDEEEEEVEHAAE